MASRNKTVLIYCFINILLINYRFSPDDTIKYLVCNKYDLRNSSFNYKNSGVGDIKIFEGNTEMNNTLNLSTNNINYTNNLTINNLINVNNTIGNMHNNNLNLNNNVVNNNANSLNISSKTSVIPLTDEVKNNFY